MVCFLAQRYADVRYYLFSLRTKKQDTLAKVDDERYQWESIRKHIMENPELAFAMVDPAPDSLQRVKTLQLLVGISMNDSNTYQDAIAYAMEGAKIAHEHNWNGEEVRIVLFDFLYGSVGEAIGT